MPGGERIREKNRSLAWVMRLRMLASKDREKARRQFMESVKMGQYGWFEYNWSNAFVKRMDHGWPKWIE